MRKFSALNIKLVDMQTHLQEGKSDGFYFSEIRYRQKMGIFTGYFAGSPDEWDHITGLGVRPISDYAFIAFGIQPQDAEKYDPDELEENYEKAPVIGVIGMDSNAGVPYENQLNLFEKQLKIASELKKPVVIRANGFEAEIAEILSRSQLAAVCISGFEGTDDELKKFVDLGCFFTAGPENCGLQKTAGLIPENKILTATYGLENVMSRNIECMEELPEAFAGYKRMAADKTLPLITEALFMETGDINTVIRNLNAFMNSAVADNCLVISGGEISVCPDPDGFAFVIAADKGFSYARHMGITPDIVVGDFDSYDGNIDEDIKNIDCLRLPVRKDESDSQEALWYALEKGYKNITVCCAMGGRFDHEIANLQMAANAAAAGAVCRLVGDRDEVCVFAGRKIEFPKKEGWSISVFALSDICSGVDIENASFPVSDYTMKNTVAIGLSNEWLDGPICVGVKQGIIAVIMSKK